MTIRYKISAVVLSVILGLSNIGILATGEESNTKSTSYDVSGKLYEFKDDSEYNFSSKGSKPEKKPDFMGSLSIKGSMHESDEKDGLPSFTVDEDSTLSISYTYDNSLRKAGDKKWHMIKDGDDVVNGIELDDDIDYGAIILQTSLDHKNWYTNKSSVNIASSEDSESSVKKFSTNEVQLSNGCYYRVIVAYELERTVEENNVLWIDKKEQKKVAEVFEFYAGYESAKDKTIPDEENRYKLGKLVYAGNDDGYSKTDEIDVDDPHYGWEMGSFFVSGYSEKTDKNVFLKNLGDRVTLWFDLEQDINKLNKNEDITVENDKNGYDKNFQIEKTNFKHGALIIRYTDYQGVSHDPVIYTDFLAALSSPGAATKVQLFEEGDYEVALDYMIEEDGKIYDSEYDYRVSFNFKIRNSNCMAYLFDLSTGAELLNGACTENGFKIDMAKSRYLNVNVKREAKTKDASGYTTTDTRENKASGDGKEYTEEGIYTITVTNPTSDPTGQNPTIKKIYVGSDNILKASINEQNEEHDANKIAELVDEGKATINDDGLIVYADAENSAVEASAEISQAPNDKTVSDKQINDNSTSDGSSFITKPVLICIIAGAVLLLIVIIIVVSKRKGRNKNET